MTIITNEMIEQQLINPALTVDECAKWLVENKEAFLASASARRSNSQKPPKKQQKKATKWGRIL
jgi:hypothetical protein